MFCKFIQNFLTLSHGLVGNVVFVLAFGNKLKVLMPEVFMGSIKGTQSAHSLVFISPRHIFHIEANQCVEEAS